MPLDVCAAQLQSNLCIKFCWSSVLERSFSLAFLVQSRAISVRSTPNGQSAWGTLYSDFYLPLSDTPRQMGTLPEELTVASSTNLCRIDWDLPGSLVNVCIPFSFFSRRQYSVVYVTHRRSYFLQRLNRSARRSASEYDLKYTDTGTSSTGPHLSIWKYERIILFLIKPARPLQDGSGCSFSSAGALGLT
jgi:hypothetical protein